MSAHQELRVPCTATEVMESGLEVREPLFSSLPERHEPDPRKELYHVQQSTGSPNPHKRDDVNGINTRRHSTERPTRVCGLGVPLFAALIAFVTAIVVGAAVGGGLGSQLNAAQDRVKVW